MADSKSTSPRSALEVAREVGIENAKIEAASRRVGELMLELLRLLPLEFWSKSPDPRD